MTAIRLTLWAWLGLFLLPAVVLHGAWLVADLAVVGVWLAFEAAVVIGRLRLRSQLRRFRAEAEWRRAHPSLPTPYPGARWAR